MDKGVAAKEVIEEWWFRSDLEDCACQGPNVRSEASKKASREWRAQYKVANDPQRRITQNQ
jgi:hypothetical protein